MSFDVFGGLSALGGGFVGYIIPFLFVLTLVVFFHELGHFLIARRAGIRVLVFSVGFGPELLGFNDRHGTRWKISAIPLGGYVKFLGDENAASATDFSAVEQMSESEKRAGLHQQERWRTRGGRGGRPDREFPFGHSDFRRNLHVLRQAKHRCPG